VGGGDFLLFLFKNLQYISFIKQFTLILLFIIPILVSGQTDILSVKEAVDSMFIYKNESPKRGIELGREIFSEVINSGSNNLKASYYMVLAESFMATNSYNTAIDYSEKAKLYFDSSTEVGLKSRYHYVMAASYSHSASFFHKTEKGKSKEDFNLIALEHVSISKDLSEQVNDSLGIHKANHLQSLIYMRLQNYEKSLTIIQSTLSSINRVDSSYSNVLISSYNMMGSVYRQMEDWETALVYFDSCEIATINRAPTNLYFSGLYWDIGYTYQLMGEYQKAAVECARGLEYANNDSILGYMLLCEECMAYNYGESGHFEKAFAHQKETNRLQLLLNKETSESHLQTKLLESDFELVIEKEQLEYEKNLAIEEETKAKQRTIIYSVGIGLILVIIFLIFVFNRLRITRKQKSLIEHQKEVVEEAHQEIQDSIAYAKRIQSAILPPDKLVKEYLKDSFILYIPKDVVAGDFYWMEQKDGKILFAAADCTGHGVPGAMVSVVCNNGLNRSVREYGLTDPGQILDKTREIVIQEFEKSEEVVKDGMDIALCSIDGNKLQYAGAHNPLWIIRNGEILETKANKQPIGQFDNPEPYLTHSFDLEPADSIYIFSDGYVDQFGGEKGKKFKSKAFRELLLSIQNNTLDEQKNLIDERFQQWKGHLEQIDDVCVIGVKF